MLMWVGVSCVVCVRQVCVRVCMCVHACAYIHAMYIVICACECVVYTVYVH